MPGGRKALFLIGLVIVAAAAIAFGLRFIKHKDVPPMQQPTPVYAGFQLTSPAFKDGKTIPVKYTCKGENISPPLQIAGTPGSTKSFALIMHDPDAVSGDFTEAFDEGHPPMTAEQGANGTDKSGYIGPCPPSGTGTHHYIFDLYALSAELDLNSGAKAANLKAAIKEHQIARTRLVGLFTAE
jgi:phosphatidylethanolamine-binding protein (PEBP) family uncharacterized protein